jgi:hypothetical protein
VAVHMARAMRVLVRMAVTWMIAVVEVMMRVDPRDASSLQLLLKALLNCWVFLIGLDLLHIEWDSDPLRKIALGHVRPASPASPTAIRAAHSCPPAKTLRR